uniref:Myelin-oligodendrocyte glycoprotein-like n=1 Tax=Oryzias melastigma TaxID=30732 RepID=A0A3B3CVV0_ORYME
MFPSRFPFRQGAWLVTSRAHGESLTLLKACSQSLFSQSCFSMFSSDLVSVSASSLWILTFSWLLFCKHVEGEHIGSVKPIIALPGDDVILPCCLDSEVDLQDYTVEWSKLEVKPDPLDRQGRVPYVYLYRNRKTMTKVMMETFIQRVSLNPDGLKRGDVTLKIRNVTLQDEGKYSCFIPGKKFRETVQLLVEPNGVGAPTMETSQFNISTPDPGGEQNNIWISRSRPGLWVSLGVFTSLIFSLFCCWVFQRRPQECQKPFLV